MRLSGGWRETLRCSRPSGLGPVEMLPVVPPAPPTQQSPENALSMCPGGGVWAGRGAVGTVQQVEL